ncbi:hypothetical protein ABRY23_13825 [Melioribacteraceae bacterium 4301-Me]|uniref:hypothetical protein n=1 Tax=Pyranulibacter aquaticus TaxID=3163344 RepID=UPI0035956400
MKKADKFKLLTFFSISLTIFLSSCIDTGVQIIPDSFNLRTQFKIVNLNTNVGNASFTIKDNAGATVTTVSNLAAGSEYPASGQPFFDTPAGSKTFSITYSGISATDEIKQTLPSDKKIRIFLIGDAGTRTLVYSSQRYLEAEKGTDLGKSIFLPDTTSVYIFNGSTDVTIDSVNFNGGGVNKTLTTAVAAGKGSGKYSNIKTAASYNVTIYSGGSAVSTFTMNAQSESRYTLVLFGSKAANNLQGKVFLDD